MTREESEKVFKRLADLLVQRGFARAYVYDDTTKTALFQFTAAGHALQQHLWQLFDVPANDPMELKPRQVADLVMLLILSPPTVPRSKPR